MPVHKMKFVVVNDMAPCNPSVCTECSRPLERGYLHDLSTSRRYCGIECLLPTGVGERICRIDRSSDSIRTRRRWPKLTVDVASALFDSAWSNHSG